MEPSDLGMVPQTLEGGAEGTRAGVLCGQVQGSLCPQGWMVGQMNPGTVGERAGVRTQLLRRRNQGSLFLFSLGSGQRR